MKNKLLGRMSLMTTLLLFSAFIVTLMFLAGWWTSRELKNRYTGFSEQLEQVTAIYDISRSLGTTTSLVSDYVNSTSPDYKKQYQETIVKILEVVASFKDRKKPDYNAFHDLDNMLHSYHEKALEAMNSKDRGDATIYVNGKIAELGRLKGYVDDQIKMIVGGRLEETRKADQNIQGALQEGENDYRRTSLLLAVICFGLAILFSRIVTKPVHVLAERLRDIGDGNFDVPPVDMKSSGEIHILTEAFYFLISRLKENIRAIQEKNEMEEVLKEARIHGLELENSSKQARLDFLQSQINPHFLYNTLNSMVTLADLEGAGKTRNMLLRLSHLMQYNLKSIRRMVSIGEELDLVASYVQIQEVRFGGRIRFEIVADASVRMEKIPGMILQPLVENAVIHGLEPLEEGGTVCISAYMEEKTLMISVEDDGKGMPPEVLERYQVAEQSSSVSEQAGTKQAETLQAETNPIGTIQADSRDASNENSSGNSLGLRNVIQRLTLQYGENPLSIESEPGKGTKIFIRLKR